MGETWWKIQDFSVLSLQLPANLLLLNKRYKDANTGPCWGRNKHAHLVCLHYLDLGNGHFIEIQEMGFLGLAPWVPPFLPPPWLLLQCLLGFSWSFCSSCQLCPVCLASRNRDLNGWGLVLNFFFIALFIGQIFIPLFLFCFKNMNNGLFIVILEKYNLYIIKQNCSIRKLNALHAYGLL